MEVPSVERLMREIEERIARERQKQGELTHANKLLEGKIDEKQEQMREKPTVQINLEPSV